MMLPEFEIFENFDDGIIIINNASIIQDANEEALRIFNYKYTEITGKNLNILMFDKDSNLHEFYVKNYTESNQSAKFRRGLELIGKRKNGEKIPLYISVMSYTKQDQKFYIGLIRDLRKNFLNERLKFNTIFIVSEGRKVEISTSGEILNKSEFNKIMKLSNENTDSTNLFQFIYKDDKDLLQTLLSSAQTGDEIHDKIVRFVDHNLNLRFFSWNSLILDESKITTNLRYHLITYINEITPILKNKQRLELLNLATDNSPNGILIANSAGIIDYVNESFLNILNKNVNEVIGKNLFKDEFFLSPDLKIDIFSSSAQESIWKGELKYFSADKNEKTLILTIFGLKNNENQIINFVEQVEDYTEFSKIYDLIQQEKEKIETILGIIPEGILLFDNENKMIEANKKVINLFSTLYDQNINYLLNDIDLLTYDTDNQFFAFLQTMIKLNKTEETLGPIQDYFFKIVMIKIKNQTVFVIYDITNENKLNEMRQHLVSTVSHELRTPISAVMQSIHNLMKYSDKLTQQDREKILRIAYSNSALLSEIVDDLLLLSKLDDGLLSYTFKFFDLSFLIIEVIQEFNTRLKEKNLQIHYNENEKFNMKGDPKRIAQIMRIFIDNAIKYSWMDSTIEISLTEVELKTTNDSETKAIQIKIRDHGRGIEKDDQKNLFKRFFRGKNVSSMKGTGLGLVIAKELADKHSGVIQVESEINKGTTFSITFPIKSDA